MITYFVVQTYSMGRKGNVVADMPVQAQSADHATRIAARLGRSKLAAIAFSRTGDPSTGDYDDANILAVFGVVPDEELQMAMAS